MRFRQSSMGFKLMGRARNPVFLSSRSVRGGGSFFKSLWRGIKKFSRVLKPILKPVKNMLIDQATNVAKNQVKSYAKNVPFVGNELSKQVDKYGDKASSYAKRKTGGSIRKISKKKKSKSSSVSKDILAIRKMMKNIR